MRKILGGLLLALFVLAVPVAAKAEVPVYDPAPVDNFGTCLVHYVQVFEGRASDFGPGNPVGGGGFVGPAVIIYNSDGTIRQIITSQGFTFAYACGYVESGDVASLDYGSNGSLHLHMTNTA